MISRRAPRLLACLVALLASTLVLAQEQTLLLKDGRRFQVSRLERRGDRIRFQVVGGGVFEGNDLVVLYRVHRPAIK